MIIIQGEFPGTPPSVNKLYYNRAHGRGLTAAGRQFKNRLTLWALRQLLDSAITTSPEASMYEVRLLFLYRDIYNEGWPKKAKNLFKKKDVDNLQKVVIDSLAKAIGVDDSSNFIVTAMKFQAEKACTHILVRSLPDNLDLNFFLGQIYKER